MTAVQRIAIGPRWRIAGVLGLAMTLAPLIMLTAEIMLAIVALVVGALVLASGSSADRELLRLAAEVLQTSEPSDLVRVMGPALMRPGVLLTAFAYIALVVPAIEELVKPLGAWVFAGRLGSASEGFGLGAASGAAYAFLESLGIAAQGGDGWALAVTIRAATGLLHVTTAALMGWAIVSAVRERRYWRLAVMYLAVVMIHGIWNASAAGIALAVLASTAGGPTWLSTLPAAAAGGLAILLGGLAVVLTASNRRLTLTAAADQPGANLFSDS
jgi:hypothetical protein